MAKTVAKTVAEIGEFGLIDRIRRRVGDGAGGPWVIGNGDDAALLRPRAGEEIAVTADTLVEGVHFRFDTQTPERVGRRALIANLSDLAAMGARPLGCTLALAVPPELPVQRVDGLARGLAREAVRHGCPVVGGNVARASEVSLAITALGAVARGRALRRDRLRPGDRLYVTGHLGGQALQLARGGRVSRLPEPRLAVGRALARPAAGCRACIDVSDGLESDLQHLLDASGVGARVDPDRLPLAPGLRAGAARLGLEVWDLCLRGGEDYELLFALPARRSVARAVPRALGVPVHEVGRVTDRPGRLEGLPETGAAGGWRHF